MSDPSGEKDVGVDREEEKAVTWRMHSRMEVGSRAVNPRAEHGSLVQTMFQKS